MIVEISTLIKKKKNYSGAGIFKYIYVFLYRPILPKIWDVKEPMFSQNMAERGGGGGGGGGETGETRVTWIFARRTLTLHAETRATLNRRSAKQLCAAIKTNASWAKIKELRKSPQREYWK